MNKLEKWRVSKEETALLGAASALLSISDLGLILDSPLWCSALTGRKIQTYHPAWTQRVYSTLIEENDLVFGAKKKLWTVTQEMMAERNYKAIGVVLNCGPALMGDDVEGICGSISDAPIIPVEAGGFTGEADQGWSDAMIALLEKVPKFSEKKNSTMNLLGCAVYDTEIKERIRKYKDVAEGGKYRIPGYEECTFDELSYLSRANENIVLHPRGLAMAKWMREQFHIEYRMAYESCEENQ